MDKIGDAQFRVMCDMWGVDSAIKAANHMGLAPTQEQIAEAMRKETETQERWKSVFRREKEEQHEREDHA